MADTSLGVEQLAHTFTARELAAKVVSAETAGRQARSRLTIAWSALSSIAQGERTADGARSVAREAMEEAKRA